MEGIYTSYKNYRLFAEKFGQGPETLIAFHGFGQNAGIYHVFDDVLKDRYTVYSFEHFHHGRSSYPSNKRKSSPFSPDDWEHLIRLFLVENNIQTFSLMGYSLGGKTALQTLEMFPERVNRLILLAPDGVIESGWYEFVSRNPAGELLYKSFINKPQILFPLMKGMTKIGVVSEKEYKFASSQLDSEVKRKLVYYTWRSYALIRPHLTTIKQIINRRKIPAHIITGKYDTVLNPRIGKAFIEGLHAGCSHVEIKASHDLLRFKTGETLRLILNA
jgi:pimeloyl-ACP methyl ester carboxylesterase